MTRVLVTGAAGFIGAHLCSRLLRDGCAVLGVDDISTGSREAVRRLLEHPGFSFEEHDVIEPYSDFGSRPERIYNLACPASPVWYQKDPVRTLKTSVYGVANALALAHKFGARILQASTSEVYGDPLEHPQAESYRGNVNPIGSRACYDEGKRAAEALVFDYHRQHGVDVRVARIFNTYGPGMRSDDGRVVSTFICQALAGEPITVHGSGRQTRSFCYVDDTVDALVRIMESGAAEPVNVGNPQEIKVRSLALMIAELCESDSYVQSDALPEDDPERRCPDISRATQLGWRPRVALEDGLRLTIDYFRPYVARTSLAAAA